MTSCNSERGSWVKECYQREETWGTLHFKSFYSRVMYRQSPIFLLLAKNLFYPTNANMATFHHPETACPHFRNSLLQSDKID